MPPSCVLPQDLALPTVRVAILKRCPTSLRDALDTVDAVSDTDLLPTSQWKEYLLNKRTKVDIQ